MIRNPALRMALAKLGEVQPSNLDSSQQLHTSCDKEVALDKESSQQLLIPTDDEVAPKSEMIEGKWKELV